MRDPRAPWPTRGTRRVHNGWLQVYRSEVQLPDGEWCHDFYRVAMKPYVVIVPMFADEQVLMLEAFRHGAQDVLTELPGGIIEPAESALEAAERELREETGYGAAQWWELPFRGVVTDPNHDCGAAYFFRASGLMQITDETDGSGTLITIAPDVFMAEVEAGTRATALPTLTALSAYRAWPWKRCAG